MFTRNEYVFVTDSRIAHHRADPIGRLAQTPVSIPFSDILGVRLFKLKIMTSQAQTGVGDILIKKTRKSYLIPTVRGGADLAEILIEELRRFRAGQGGNECDD